ISLICTGPGPVWADGASMVTVRWGSAISGRSKGTGGTERARTSVSVMFQKAFQKWTSRGKGERTYGIGREGKMYRYR
uniref:Uncharacterized protein n=1 Tax=Hucho hucho TaxID=62062 RepID=A0A4W5Q567_9TELE